MSLFRGFYFLPVLALLTVPAWGDVLYSDGAVNGTILGWEIDSTFAVTDAFVITSDSTVTDLSNIGIWVLAGDSLSSLNWTISTAPNDGGTVEGSATDAVPESAIQLTPAANFGNNGVFDVYNVSFSVPNLFLAAGTYYLTLENATSTGAVAWDESDGPSPAAQYFNGSFLQDAGANSFEVDSAPEPASLLLLGAGLVGLGALKKVRAGRG